MIGSHEGNQAAWDPNQPLGVYTLAGELHRVSDQFDWG